MKNFFTIRQTAKMVDMTAETLRHYDRIDLVKPCKIDEWTGYRYYSPQEIVRLNTIRALRCMDLTLLEIKDILEYNNLHKIIALLNKAEKSADKKIAELQSAKLKIQRACTFYERKVNIEQNIERCFIQEYPQRVILLSNFLTAPTLDNLWNYHRHYYKQIPESAKDAFFFEDLAGIYVSNGRSQMFTVCTEYEEIEGIQILPQGRYLCVDCTEENREQVLQELFAIAKEKYAVSPSFTIQLIVLSGILQWNYQLQIYVGKRQ